MHSEQIIEDKEIFFKYFEWLSLGPILLFSFLIGNLIKLLTSH